MADHVAVTAGSGTTIATDECTVAAALVQVQRVKAGWGADGAYNDPSESAPLPVQVIPVGSVAAAAMGAQSTALASALQATTAASTLYGVSGVSTRTTGQWIQVWDAAAAPSTGSPLYVLWVPPAPAGGGANFSLSLPQYGRRFAAGIYVCNSTTMLTRTAGAADCFFATVHE